MSDNSMKIRIADLLDERMIDIPHSMNARMNPSVIDCDEAAHSITLSFPTGEWMSNPNHFIHGGILSTMADISMGALAYYLADDHLCPTGSLNVNFLRPGLIGPDVISRAQSSFIGRTVIHTTCEMCMASDPDKVIATASGVFVNVHKSVRDRQS